jgi:hypothetical protein
MESIADAVHQSTAPAFVLAAIGATLSALIARHVRVFEQMREISMIEGDQELLNQAMALMLARYRLLGNATRLALSSAIAMCALVIVTFLDVTLPLNFNVLVAAGFFLSMTLLIGCYAVFFRDIRLANRSTRMYIDRLFAATHR